MGWGGQTRKEMGKGKDECDGDFFRRCKESLACHRAPADWQRRRDQDLEGLMQQLSTFELDLLPHVGLSSA